MNLFAYGGDYVSGGGYIFNEYMDGYVGDWRRRVNTVIAEEDTVRKRFWIWTRWMDTGSWSLTTIGIIDEHGRMRPPFGSYDAIEEWSSSPRVGDEEQGVWWLVQLTQAPKTTTEGVGTTKPLKGTIGWRACTLTVTSSITYNYVRDEKWGDGFYTKEADLHGEVYDSITEETTVFDAHYTRWGLAVSWPREAVDAFPGSYTKHFNYESESEAGEDLISLGNDDIKTWDYYRSLL
jgi:hypothetical protein